MGCCRFATAYLLHKKEPTGNKTNWFLNCPSVNPNTLQIIAKYNINSLHMIYLVLIVIVQVLLKLINNSYFNHFLNF